MAMNFEKEIHSDRFVLRLSGDLIGDDNGARLLEASAEAIQKGILTAVIDISSLRYINSNGIGVLISILTRFRNKGGEVYLLKPSESVQKLLVITKLNSIFQIIGSEEDIVKS